MNDVIIPDDLPGVEEANAELERLMAADAAGDNSGGQTNTQESAKANTAQGERAAQTGAEVIQEQQTDPNSDTPSTADSKATDQDKAKANQAKAPTEGKAKSEDSKTKESRFAKEQGRQRSSWEAINQEKAKLQEERQAIERERQEFDQRRKQAEEQFSPEAYETAAKKFEEEGEFKMAELAKKKAEDLRKNPPQAQADKAKTQHEAACKEWALKAGIDFPEIAKTNSPLQMRVAQLMQEEPDLKSHPKGIYLAARLANLETAAASVPQKDKELEQLRAKVKELEGLTSPSGGGSATALPATSKAFEQMSPDEQFAELNRMASEQGTLR